MVTLPRYRCASWVGALSLISTLATAQTPETVSDETRAPVEEAETPTHTRRDPSHAIRVAAKPVSTRFVGDDQALAARTTMRLELPVRRVTVVGELQDSRAYLTDSESNVSTSVVDAADLLQAHVRIGVGPTCARRDADWPLQLGTRQRAAGGAGGLSRRHACVHGRQHALEADTARHGAGLLHDAGDDAP